MALKHVGKVMDAHGIKGEIYCLIFSGDASWCDQLASLELKKSGEQKSFEILKLKPFKKGFIAALKGFSNRNIAEEYKGAELWVDESLFVSDDGDAIFLSELLNFKLIDKRLGPIGEISNFSSNGIQDLLIVNGNSNESFEVPFVKDYVLDIDFNNKLMKVDLPDGLLEINKDDES